ncbi:site-specific integrase [Flavisolibacter ginsenosidimutans]|uniref:Tyrosine-type recombinase/integrase n=1 Tax=Flavisolibacter ginsenosidimutans TaxID=661481 RepID=A0A5B8UQX7_9BACT|nr:site-specific integrase [Flavisolibacter ginsenosidimutans]QEC58380.1 tyrosine-type recombinase/integrase [Flavisolibacter ginsenosidimutans]
MSKPIKPVIKKGAIRKDGTSIIFIQYCRSAEQRTLVDSGISIPPNFWNRKTGRISETLPFEYGNAIALQEQLVQKLRRAEDMVDYAIKKSVVCPMKFLKNNFSLGVNWQPQQMKNHTNSLDVFQHIDDYVASKTGSVKKCTINVINAMKSHLQLFEAHRKEAITFDSFDANFYESFVQYLTHEVPQVRRKALVKGLKANTAGKTIKHLKAFLKDRMWKKMIPHIDLTGYKVLEEEVDAIYISWEELSVIYHMDLSATTQLEKYRDLFVLGCLTGFRFSDYSDIRPEEVRNGMLYVNQAKTHSTVVVPLRADARTILIDRYKMQMPQVSNVNFNYYIKEVVRLAGIAEPIKIVHKRGNKTTQEIRPKYAWVTSHTCRRSFCTNEFLAGTPTNLIMAISGHKTEKAFRRYIKAEQVQKAEMIKKIWDSRPNL